MSQVQYRALQDPGEEPRAVLCKDDQGIPRLYVPGRGLVHMPTIAPYIYEGEVGAERITEAEAMKLMRAGVGRMQPKNADTMKGTADTIPVPDAP